MKKLMKDQSGMTLIDVAMILMVLGLLLAPALETYRDWKIKKERDITRQNQLAINKAIADYYFINGRYPCPADPTRAPGNADYGTALSVMTGTVVTGCNAAIAVGGGAAYIGAVPFTDLLLPTDVTLDGFTNKFTYAVSANLVVTATFGTGALTINGRLPDPLNRECGGDKDVVRTEAHFMLVSHGPSGAGAFTAEGRARQACPAPGVSSDNENCDGDLEFTEDFCIASETPGSDEFYDDLTFYTWSPPTRIWSESSADPDDVMTNVAKVGINNTNPQFNLDVVGNIKTSDTWANQICDLGDTSDPSVEADCFRPELIGGDEPDMDCANNTSGSTIMTGIGGSRAKCNISHTLPATDCAATGRYIVGIGPNGEVICGS